MLIKSMSAAPATVGTEGGSMVRMLESEEAARRLGVKVATLYAYVSRGLLVSHPAPSGRRRSQFDGAEVERLARRSRGGRSVETRMATITTGITQLTDEGPVYRGLRAVDLATTTPFEAVAAWLWHQTDPVTAWEPVELVAPPELGSSDRLRWAVVMAGAHDRLRADRRPEAVRRRAVRLAASMVEMLPRPGDRSGAVAEGSRQATPAREDTSGPTDLVLPDGRVHAGSMAGRLAAKLCPDPDQRVVRWVNAALVLLADHELATSTLAVRVAGSTRADLYDALLAGLGTIAGPLHGGASQQAYGLLVDAERHGVERAVDDTLRWQGVLPGFGHSVYTSGDARFEVLFGLLGSSAAPEQVELVASLIGLVADHDIPPPNVDLALAATAWATGMPPDAGRTLFTVARVAGWVAHYLEELEERPLRYRARAVYASPGPPPGPGPGASPGPVPDAGPPGPGTEDGVPGLR
jgi:citrate synthase